MKALIDRWIKPYSKLIAGIVGVAAFFLTPEQWNAVVAVGALLGLYFAPKNVPVSA